LPRLIAALERPLHEEADAGHLDLPVDLHELAYVIVRIIESYIYLDVFTGEDPDAQRAGAGLEDEVHRAAARSGTRSGGQLGERVDHARRVDRQEAAIGAVGVRVAGGAVPQHAVPVASGGWTP
jgi:hypothetical protein